MTYIVSQYISEKRLSRAEIVQVGDGVGVIDARANVNKSSLTRRPYSSGGNFASRHALLQKIKKPLHRPIPVKRLL